MELWEKVFVGVTIGLVMIIAIANAVYLLVGKVRRRRARRRASHKIPRRSDKP